MTRPWLLPMLVCLSALALLLGIAVGTTSIPPARIVAALAGQGDPVERAVLIELRLPRAILGLAIGAMLGYAGAVLQGYLRNPLADPGVLGISSGASLGAVVALYFGLADLAEAMLPALAIAGALATLVLLFALTRRSDGALSLVLAGVAVSTLLVAGISLALNLSSNPFAALEITTWLLGSLEDRSFLHVALALPCIGAALLLLAGTGSALDALTLGEETAATLGIDLVWLRWRLLLGIAIGVGGAVAVSGAIGFVGLIVPHLVRPLTDRRPSSVLWPSAAAGAALLALADVAVRVIPATNELKLGVVTAFLGVPVFLAHLRRERRLW